MTASLLPYGIIGNIRDKGDEKPLTSCHVQKIKSNGSNYSTPLFFSCTFHNHMLGTKIPNITLVEQNSRVMNDFVVAWRNGSYLSSYEQKFTHAHNYGS